MRVAYVDMIGGASGNMLLGAFIDAGLELDAVLAQLRSIPVEGWTIDCKRVDRRGVSAIYADVIIPGEDDHHDHPEAHRHPPGRRTLADVLDIYERSGLSATAKRTASRVAARLAEVEAGDRFHAVGQVDAILDIAATCIAVDLLEIRALFCSAFPVGGRLPQETQRLLAGKPTRRENVAGEMVTATGAAILTSLVAEPGVRPAFNPERSGYGAGRSDFPMPNVTRIEIGENV